MVSPCMLLLAVVAAVGATAIDSSAWRDPSFLYPDTPRSHQGAAALIPAMTTAHTVAECSDGQNYEYCAQVYTQMAEFVFLGNSTSYIPDINEYLLSALGTRANFEDTNLDYGLAYGYAALRTYFVSGRNTTFLGYAIQSWEWANAYVISEGKTTVASKSPNFSSQCQNMTMAGGTFATTAASDISIGARATGYFALVSAMLAQATSNTTYFDAAVASASFLFAHLQDPTRAVPYNSLEADSCAPKDTALDSNNAALLLETMSILGALTSGADQTKVQTLANALIVAILEYDGWQTAEGIITNGPNKVGDGLLARALGWAYVYNGVNQSNRGYIYSYLAVQYNALIQLATTNTTTPAAGATSDASNVYGGQWTGPPPTVNAAPDLTNQTNAVNLLIAASWVDFPSSPAPPALSTPMSMPAGAFFFTNASSTGTGSASSVSSSSAVKTSADSRTTTTSSSNDSGGKPANSSPNNTSNANPSSSSHKKSPAGAIAGGIVGGLLLIVAIALLCQLLARRRARARRAVRRSEDPTSPTYIQPFMSEAYSDATPGVIPPTPGSNSGYDSSYPRPSTTCSCAVHHHHGHSDNTSGSGSGSGSASRMSATDTTITGYGYGERYRQGAGANTLCAHCQQRHPYQQTQSQAPRGTGYGVWKSGMTPPSVPVRREADTQPQPPAAAGTSTETLTTPLVPNRGRPVVTFADEQDAGMDPPPEYV
ncbi:Glycoside hydrolase family 76 protein [Mycena chlorophos]|uniref:receptor protein-tyrosine kinase n=1 Tax=Mycena chlorophos TaxID=658473 RepID=A0A8H6SP59_MYCCL|nr:Glycoside hydrolase family 76 protein [Mycena chlorophos]